MKKRMFNYRFWLISLMLFTGFALNIERLDIGEAENIVDMASFVYVLAGAAVLSSIVLPRKWKIPTSLFVAFWVVVYAVVKALSVQERPAIGGVYTYLTVVEVVLIILLVIMTRILMGKLQELEEIVSNITLVDVSNRVKNLDSSLNDVNKEFARSRRYKRPLGVVVIRLKSENVPTNLKDLSTDILRMIVPRYLMNNLIRAVDKEIRRPDFILEQRSEDRIVLLLPEANAKAIKAVSANVQKIARDKVGAEVEVGVAAFPDDAVTFDDLLSRAEREIETLNNSASENQHSDLKVESTKQESENTNPN